MKFRIPPAALLSSLVVSGLAAPPVAAAPPTKSAEDKVLVHRDARGDQPRCRAWVPIASGFLGEPKQLARVPDLGRPAQGDSMISPESTVASLRFIAVAPRQTRKSLK